MKVFSNQNDVLTISYENDGFSGGHWEHEEAIPDGDILEFARAIEKAVLFDELQTWTTSRWSALQETKDERCGKCGRMFWHHIKAKMNLEI